MKKPVEHTEDFLLKTTDDKSAPITLVRLILAGGPLSERQICFTIFKLAIFSGTLELPIYEHQSEMSPREFFCPIGNQMFPKHDIRANFFERRYEVTLATSQ